MTEAMPFLIKSDIPSLVPPGLSSSGRRGESAAALVVGNAFGLGGPGLLGGESQHRQGHQVRQHPVQVRADSQLRQQVHPVAVDVDRAVGCGNALEQTEQQGCSGDVQGFPVAEDHNRQGQEAKARHIAVGGAVGGGQGVHETAHACQRTGDGGAGIAHFVHVDAQAVRRLGIFTAGAKPQAKAGLVQQDRQHNEKQNAHIGGQVHLVQEGLSQEADIRRLVNAEGGLLQHEPGGGIAGGHHQGILVHQHPDQEQHQGGSHQGPRQDQGQEECDHTLLILVHVDLPPSFRPLCWPGAGYPLGPG